MQLRRWGSYEFISFDRELANEVMYDGGEGLAPNNPLFNPPEFSLPAITRSLLVTHTTVARPSQPTERPSSPQVAVLTSQQAAAHHFFPVSAEGPIAPFI